MHMENKRYKGIGLCGAECGKTGYVCQIQGEKEIRIQEGASSFALNDKISLPVTNIVKIMLRKIQKEAPPCIRMEASYMAELAVALPFFTGFMVALLFFFQALMVQQEVGNALLAAGRELSVLACEADLGNGGGILSAKALTIKHLKGNQAAEQFVRGGRAGIALAGSDFSGNYIHLQADYKLRLPIGLFGKRDIKVTQKLTCRKWTGRSSGDGAEEQEKIVYITPKGSVYHRKRDCSYLNPSVRGVSGSSVFGLRNLSGEKYYPCESCMKKKKTDMMTVYITTYGNRYHRKRDCSGIKRSILAIRLSQAGSRNACSKCGKG